ncbi:MAG: sugar ABC transporter permease [Betaproteobacteria bacterium]|nr:sugar ABC transporter permease [Betaproteobacteria bacterium]MDE2122541.1 sugar ABC transporter permease [Betaproteobacteria bacterium]MDE2187976.1 sugar ABC transporter permease [Betaproteobacteria bacterium]MDE2323051.1 sugar ABC transporter permease [Betaproteobacteria bacterium]NNM63504.1 sugar ABC transporter permease [Burkholderiales bacterium]
MKAGILPKLMLSPSVLLVLACVYGFIAYTVYLSFTASQMLPNYEWVGMTNYTILLGLQNWWISVNNLWIFALLYIVVCMALGLFLAILIDQKIRAESMFRSIFLYPMALSFIVVGTAWKWLFDPGVGFQHVVRMLGWSDFTLRWVTESHMAIYCIVVAAIWQATGFIMAMFIAGLRGIDTEPVNAARIDGARTWQIYVHVIIPQLAPVFASAFVVLVTMAIKSYDLVVALTSGGPANGSWLPSVFMYQYTFTRSEMGVGSASSVLMLLAVGLFVLPYLVSEVRRIQHG